MCKKFIAFAVVALMVCFVAPLALAQNGPPPRPDASCTNCKLPITCHQFGVTPGTECDDTIPEYGFSGCVNYTCSGSCTIKVTLTATGLVQGKTYSLQTCNAPEIGRGVAAGKQGNLTIVGQANCADLWQFSEGSNQDCGFPGPPSWILLGCENGNCPFTDYIGNTNDGGVGVVGYVLGTGISCPEECFDDG